MTGYFLRGLTLGMSAMAMPGPFQAFLLAQALKNGWRRTLPAALAPLVSDGPVVALVLLVLTQMPDWFLAGLRLAGGLFMLYLAWGAWQATKVNTSDLKPNEATGQNFFKAALMNALSPGPYLFWSILAGPLVIEGWRQSPLVGLSFVLGFYLTLIGGFAVFIILSGTASRLGPQVNRVLSAISALALLGFGLYQLGLGVGSWLG